MDLNPLAQIDLVTVGITILVFVATYILMRKIFFDRTVAVMEVRHQRCDEAARACEEARTHIVAAEQQAAEVMADARAQADAVVTAAREEAEAEKSSRIAEARQAAETRLQQGRKEILEARDREIAALRAEAVECVGLACEKLAGSADPDVVTGVVDRLVTKTLQ